MDKPVDTETPAARSGPSGRPVPRAVLFDMDGLLLDSERLSLQAFEAACSDLGLAADLAVYYQCIGSTYERTEELLTAAFGPDFSYETLDQHWGRHYHARLAEGPVPVEAGARELLRFLAASGIPRALVTSTRRVTAVDKLQRTQLLAFFGFLVCGGETDLGKPHPDPYLAAADGLGIAPEHCWALEDSANGVRAAHGAGCRVFQVPDLVAPTDDLRDLGHDIVTSLEDVLRLLEQR